MGITIAEFQKALSSLDVSIQLYHRANPQDPAQKAFRDACIQRFEYCIELSWKLSLKLLGSTTSAAKPAVREMARSGIISDPSLWIEFIEARNSTSHSYDEEVATKVFRSIEQFLPEARKLEAKLQSLGS